MNNMRIDSVWDLLVARIAALEARVDELEAQLDAGMDGICAALDEDDPDGWIGGTESGEDETDEERETRLEREIEFRLTCGGRFHGGTDGPDD